MKRSWMPVTVAAMMLTACSGDGLQTAALVTLFWSTTVRDQVVRDGVTSGGVPEDARRTEAVPPLRVLGRSVCSRLVQWW